VAERGKDAEHTGISDQDVELAVAFMQRSAQPVDARLILEVERDQCGLAADRADGVVELFQPTDRARDCDDVRAGTRQRTRY
jgi:hypothetical protein